MNVTGALQSGMIGLNRTFDNVQKASGDQVGSGQPERPEEATGRTTSALQAVDGTTQSGNEVASTQVVSETEKTVGGNIDLHV